MIIKNFHVSPGKSCYFASLTNLFQYYGIDIYEAELYILCNSMYFEFDEANFQNNHFSLNIYHSMDLYKTLEQFFDCRISEIRGFNQQECVYAIRSKSPPIMFIRSNALYYHTRHYQLENIEDTHTTIIYGIDLDQNTAYIADSYIVEDNGAIATYQGKFPLQQIIQNTEKMLFFTMKSISPFDRSELYRQMTANIDRFLEYKFENGKHLGNYAMVKCLTYIKNLAAKQHPCLNNCLKEMTYFISAHFINKFDYIIDLLRDKYKEKSIIVTELFNLKTEWIAFSTALFHISYKKNTARTIDILDHGIDLVCKQERILQNIKKIIIN